MKNIFFKGFSLFASMLLGALTVISCSSDDNSKRVFDGDNMIVLKAMSTLSMQDNSEDKIVIEVLLITALKEQLDLEFQLTDNVIDGKVIAELDNPKVSLEPGQKRALLTISSKTRMAITENAVMKLELVRNSSKVNLEKNLELLITPIERVVDLTAAQVELIEGYKKLGLDLYPLLGEIDVEGMINYKGNEYLTPINAPAKIPVQGKTIITLSEKATADKPILKMVTNPMGIEAYSYYLFRELTINDKEFWTNQPAPMAIMELLNLTSSSNESFTMSLDGIEIDLKTKEVNIIGAGEDSFGNPITVVPFKYEYSAWNRLQKLLKQGNAIAIENNEQGGSVNPALYLNTGSILEKDDEYKNNTWNKVETKLTEDKLSFQFIIDHYQASGFITFNIEYKLNNK